MYKIISFWVLICMCFMSATAYAQESTLSNESNFIINRGIFGIGYKLVVGVLKVVEYIAFGRYGIKGVNDYFRPDKIFYEKTPKY